MSKITLINIRISNTVFMPLGLLYLAAVLEKNGFKVQVIDPFTYEPEEKALRSIKAFNPKYIGFSMVTPGYLKTKWFKKKITNFFPDKVYFAGGIHPTVLPEETLTDIDLDFVVRGEGEYTLLDALRRLEGQLNIDGIKGISFRDGNGGVKNNSPRDLIDNLDEIPLPARHLLDIERYFIPPGYIRGYFMDRVVNVITSRGCPMSCIFCCSQLLSGKRVRKRSVKNIMQEIDLLIENFRVKAIYFSDETFTTDNDWLMDFSKEIKKRRLPWGCATRIDLIDEPLIKQMKGAGCIQIDLGVESGSNRILEILKKGIVKEKIKDAFSILKKNKIRSFATVMVGNPQETKNDVIETKNLLKSIKPDYTHITWFTPFPGTAAYQWMTENRVASDNLREDYDFVTASRPLVNLTQMSLEELVLCRALLDRTVFFANYIPMINFNNLRYITEAFIFSLCSPLGFLRALSISIKNHSFSPLIYFIFYNYQRIKITEKILKLHDNSK